MYRPVTNKIRCKWCGDILESFSTHDFKTCRCGKCFIDGGHEYARRGWDGDDPDKIFEDLSSYYDTETGKTLTANDMKELGAIEIVASKNIPEEKPSSDAFESLKYQSTDNTSVDIPKEPEDLAPEEEKLLKDSEVVTERDEGGKPIAGRYPYGAVDPSEKMRAKLRK